VTARVDGEGPEQWPDLAEAFLVLALVVVPIPVVMVVVGPSREILPALSGYGLFVVGSLVLTVLIRERAGEDDSEE
jgi:hypothetical protein